MSGIDLYDDVKRYERMQGRGGLSGPFALVEPALSGIDGWHKCAAGLAGLLILQGVLPQSTVITDTPFLRCPM
ncbi:hypothetical protein BW247_13645 [Acidihalobacter ferrooxydans]|uniref:Uncharacterized protein n=1 Tax=Acidihalobacter ferrooxydans TaxID=1765967 RepID=A0A1P8UJN9_9GAMM|nr:hypothetical protein BW247_13645 [Acidihalobacter ferrooxydans]